MKTFKHLLSLNYGDDDLQKPRKEFLSLHKDHQTQLIFALRLIQGNPNDSISNWPSDLYINDLVSRINVIFSKHLIYHFLAEEDILFDRIRPFLKNKEELNFIEILLNQHREINSQISILNKKKSTIEIKDSIKKLGYLLAENVKAEEEKFLPLIEKTLPEPLINQIHLEIVKRTQVDFTHLL